VTATDWPADLGVSRETEARLTALVALVARWTPRINLISTATLPEIETRHILDSAQLLAFAQPHWAHWADLGSGGGFPGLVIAILTAESHPSARITLVESDQRKATFLRTAIRDLALTAQVQTARAESLPPLAADVLSARALAPLPALLPLALRHLAPGGRALFPKGRRAEDEIAEARRVWHFDLTSHPSRTDPEARILQIEGIAHV
jgi:16S rRNA (guanine527-N7)-methyltransferase